MSNSTKRAHRRPDGLILDLDGTVYRGDRLIPGADQVVAYLRRHNYDVIFVTNAIESRIEHAEKLTKLGIPASPADIINSPLVLTTYLKKEMPDAVLYPISDPPLREELALHFRMSEDPDEVDVVIASSDRSFNFYKLNIGFQALRRGARFFATNIDATWPLLDGEIPDAGAIIGALEGCTQRKLELVAGKPSSLVAEAALQQLKQPAEACLVVGDRIETDIVMGQRAGMQTALVLTGATQPDALACAPVQPDHTLGSIAELPSLLESQVETRQD
jgi:HAD superfamily hydrolase (TIGR01450 family)